MTTIERDVLDRLDRAGVGYYITGPEALSVWAEPRQTLDIDIVTDLAPNRYEAVIRPAFEDAYLVNDLIVAEGRGYGSVIHRTEVRKADLMMRRDDAWGRAAFERLLAKLSWSDGGASERQLRDSASITRIQSNLDWAYVDRYADALGISELVERVRGDR